MNSIHLISNTLVTKFPPQFCNSKNRKIIIKRCHVLRSNNSQAKDDNSQNTNGQNDNNQKLILHGDFITRDQYLDHFICLTNETFERDYKVIDYQSPNREFRIWFSTIEKPYETINVESFILELELLFD